MIKLLEIISKIIRRHYCPRRLYRYGLTAIKRGYFDDRTKFEKVMDSIDEYVLDNQLKQRYMRAKLKSFFKPYFDHNWGVKINSLAEIKALEKAKGGEYVSVREWDEIRKKKDNERERVHLKQIESGIKEVIRDVRQGRSFKKEMREHQIKTCREHGITFK